MTSSKTSRPTRETIAMREVGHTLISARLAAVMTTAFLLLILAVPVAQLASEFGAMHGTDTGRRKRPRMFDLLDAIPATRSAFANADGGPFRKLFVSNAELLRRINDYEDAIERRSVLAQTLRGPIQWLLLRFLGQGNEKAYAGRDGWLFFSPDIRAVSGPGFLEPRILANRRLSGNEYTPAPHPNPLPAIRQFHRELKARGILLILVPVPAKPTVHPEFFSARFKHGAAPVHNPSYARFIAELTKTGILVLDPTPTLEETVNISGMPQYLATDTHWRPGPMEVVARRLADMIGRNTTLSGTKREYVRVAKTVTALGDIARMLELPASQRLFEPETVSIREVREKRSGTCWRPSRSADILLLGDSFSNIYSSPAMGWGQAAGFAEQLSFFLQRPVDVIIRNDAGAYATREALAARAARGDDPLIGKTVVVWQFAARELAFGDWREWR